MQTKRPYLFSSERGFTLVELMMVTAIMMVLAAIGMKAFAENRQKTANTQALVGSRNMLSLSSTDAPVPADPNADEVDARTDGSVGHYNEFQVNFPVWTNVRYSGADKIWQFFMAHVGGDLGYYFWIPGDGCTIDLDPSGNRSDTIVQNIAYRSNASGIGPYP